MEALTIGLAKELAPQGVRVNVVCPGKIETEIHVSAGRVVREQIGEVAEAILWLVDGTASYSSSIV